MQCPPLTQHFPSVDYKAGPYVFLFYKEGELRPKRFAQNQVKCSGGTGLSSTSSMWPLAIQSPWGSLAVWAIQIKNEVWPSDKITLWHSMQRRVVRDTALRDGSGGQAGKIRTTNEEREAGREQSMRETGIVKSARSPRGRKSGG